MIPTPLRAPLSLVIAMVLAQAAAAQDAPPASRQAPTIATQLDTVTVTSQYRPESQQDVPLAITAFSAETIRDAGIKSPGDFVAMTPNISYDESFSIGNSFVSVRGMQQLNNADAPMAVVVDGVPQSSQKQFKMDLFDIERIEVLRGPQGALYGRNAIGGAINIFTRTPTEAFEGDVQATAGGDGLLGARAAVSGSSADGRVGYRIAASTESYDGSLRNTYLDRIVDNYDSRDGRVRVNVKASDNLDLDFRLSGSRLKGGAIYDTSFDPDQPDNSNTRQAPISDVLGSSERGITDASIKADWKHDWGRISAITAYTALDEQYYGDLDFCNPVQCPAGIFGLGQADQAQDLDVRLLSQEIRVSSPDDQPLRWTAGTYVLKTRRDLSTIANLTGPGIRIVDTRESNDNLAWAVFGQADWSLSDVNDLTVSLRYDKDEREQTDAQTGARRNISFDAIQPRVSLRHAFNERQSAYVTYATGFRSGGFNGIAGRPFADERLKSIELGYKALLLDNRLQLDTAVFNQTARDYQFFYVDLNAGGAQVIDNLAEVEMRGIELEARWLLRPGLEVGANYGRLISRINALDASLTVPARVDNKAPRTQDYEAGVHGQWNFPLTDTLTGMLRMDVERRGPRTWMPDNADVMRAFNLLNARASIQGYNWALTLWGKNLTDRAYYGDFVSNEFSGLGRDVAFPARGRTWGMDLRYSF